ncbi:ABC transporter substrate-binding protein [Psychromonas sp. KJ10-10]|uniref:ABC transporter substrate-binding protein n=1 Tax=Psychromonas sp. KJ10-10 TaxID=3391823 RepID=UPI0039B37959
MFANSIEVLHWWTAPGEIEAQAVLKDALSKQGVEWKNFAIVGSGGNSALRVLQMRALSGNPPEVAQIKGPDIAEWAKMGMLTEVDNIVVANLWEQYLPEIVRETISYKGHYMALPLNVHRVNWLWLNKAIFEELNLTAPQTWSQFIAVAEKIKKAGYIPLAHGGTTWQDSLLFESVALSLLGAEKYKKAFVDFDESILTSQQMLAVFKQFKVLNRYISKELQGKDWVTASRMLSDKKAAMQFMGDWAKGMWQAEGKVAMQDYLCVDVPESKHLFSYNIDSFVFFKKITLSIKSLIKNYLLKHYFPMSFNRTLILIKAPFLFVSIPICTPLMIVLKSPMQILIADS